MISDLRWIVWQVKNGQLGSAQPLPSVTVSTHHIIHDLGIFRGLQARSCLLKLS